DAIALEPRAVYVGPFTLPAKRGPGWIVIRTAADERDFISPGTRIEPGDAYLMPKLMAARGSVIEAAPGAHHYRFVGVEIHPRAGAFLYNLVQLGDSHMTADEVPHHIVFDRCYLH